MSVMKGTAKTGVLRRSADEAKNYALWMKILRISVAAITAFTVIIYVVAVLYTKFGSFTVTINKFDSLEYGIALCETPEFPSPVLRLNAKACEDVTNISGDWIAKDVNKIDGSHNGENYLAYTYYCKNMGTLTLDYEYYLYIANVTNKADTAVRFRVYIDPDIDIDEDGDFDYTDYARTRTDGGGAEPKTTEFLTSTGILRGQVKKFKPGQITKYTVVIWIEGDDPDCVDDLMGGSIKSDMSISVVSVESPETKDKD